MTPPLHLLLCPGCGTLQRWRAAGPYADPIERVEPHRCPHDVACGPRPREHGRSVGEALTDRGCKTCRAPGPERGCLTCAELARQHGGAMPAGGWCLALLRRKDSHDFVHVSTPYRIAQTGHPTGEATFACPYRTGELPPPWCAAPGADEKSVEAGRNAFVLVLPEALRDGAMVAAEKTNAKRCMTWCPRAEPELEPVKQKRGKDKADNQTKLF